MPNSDEPVTRARDSVDELVSRHAEALYSYAMMRVGDNELAEDMVQETLLAALQSWESFAGNSSERTWLIGILRHKILDYFRQHRDTEQANDGAWRTVYFDQKKHWKNKIVDWKTNPSMLAENKEFWKVLSDCLKELSQIMAKAFVMRELEGMNTEQVCKHLEISQTNLWVRLHRARLQLRRCLELNWFA
jgi:RNA polymerase sigma-70 factor (ECF subfamily)